MFDELVSVADSACGGAAVGAWARVENAACARRLSAMADVLEKRWSEDGSADRDQWCFDNWNAVAAEIAAHHGVSLGVASHQLLIAMALRERLTRVDEVFHTGRISFRLVSAIVSRTALITDPHARAKVDIELAAAIAGWGVLSQATVEQNIDDLVEHHDPYAVRRTEAQVRGRHVDRTSDGGGTSTIEAVLLEHDAAAVDARLEAMARAVCDADPRTLDQRRADALGAIGHGADRLACQCGSDDCDAAGVQPNAVVLNLIAEENTLSDDTPVSLDGENPDKSTKPLREMTLAEAAGRPAAERPGPHTAGGDDRRRHHSRTVVGGEDRCGSDHSVHHPSWRHPTRTPLPRLDHVGSVRPVSRYDVPVPGLLQPADICDLDHTIAYPVGPTCASNLKCLCREHHLLKTFWAGRHGWQDRQLPDGTVIWTDPNGQIHTTRPGSYALFPKLCEPTAPVVLRDAPSPPNTCTLTMPRRQRTRPQDRAARIAAERRLNETDPQPRQVACAPTRSRGQSLAEWLATLPPGDDEPPPF